MVQSIDRLLHRRADLSTFLVHLAAGKTAEDTLFSIMFDRNIEARTPYGLLKNYVNDNRKTELDLYESQKVVCFTETPLEHVWMMCSPMENRQRPLAEYGLAFPKAWARKKGINPVWYINTLRTGHEWLTVALMDLMQQTINDGASVFSNSYQLASGKKPKARPSLDKSPIAKVAPFIEEMGPVGSGQNVRRREFWWEREWRRRGDVPFAWKDIVALFVPEDRHTAMKRSLTKCADSEPIPALLDPRWGLERMISALAGVPVNLAGPLPEY